MSPIVSSKRDLRTSADLTPDEIGVILDRAAELKAGLTRGQMPPLLAGRTLAIFFEKPSLRTRCTFEIGMNQLGGHAIYLTQNEIGLGKR